MVKYPSFYNFWLKEICASAVFGIKVICEKVDKHYRQNRLLELGFTINHILFKTYLTAKQLIAAITSFYLI